MHMSLPNEVTGLITIKFGHAGHTCLVFSAAALSSGHLTDLPGSDDHGLRRPTTFGGLQRPSSAL